MSKSLPRSVNVTIFEGTDDERSIQVPKLKLGKAAQLIAAFQRLPERAISLTDNPEIAEIVRSYMSGESNDTPVSEVAKVVLSHLPSIIGEAQDTVIEILSIGTGLSHDEVADVSFDEATELLLAILEVNNLERIQENLKNVMRRLGLNRFKLPQATPTIGSSTSSTPLPTGTDGVKSKP